MSRGAVDLGAIRLRASGFVALPPGLEIEMRIATARDAIRVEHLVRHTWPKVSAATMTAGVWLLAEIDAAAVGCIKLMAHPPVGDLDLPALDPELRSGTFDLVVKALAIQGAGILKAAGCVCIRVCGQAPNFPSLSINQG